MYVRTSQLAREGFRNRSLPSDDGNVRPQQNYGVGELIVPRVPSLNNPWKVQYPTSYNRRATSDLRGLSQFFPSPGGELSPGPGDTGAVYGSYPGKTPPSDQAAITLPVTFRVTSSAPYPAPATNPTPPQVPGSVPSGSPFPLTAASGKALLTGQNLVAGVPNWAVAAALIAALAVLAGIKRKR